MRVSRRSLLRAAGVGSVLGTGGLAGGRAQPREPAPTAGPSGRLGHAGHAMGPVGRVSTTAFDPTAFLRSWNFSHLAETDRATFYRETGQPDGTPLREYDIVAIDREIEIAPGVFFPAWTYN